MSEKDFQLAANFVRKAPPSKGSNSQKLEFYKYYKQGSEGDVNAPRPAGIKLVERAKWDAWNSVKGTPKTEAQKKYVGLVERDRPTWKEDAKRLGISTS